MIHLSSIIIIIITSMKIILITDIAFVSYNSPALGLAVVVPLNLRLLDFKHWRSLLMRIVIMTKAMVSKVMIMNVL